MPYKQWYEDLGEIKRRCRERGTLFEDPEFPAIDSKVFKKRVLPGGQSFEWLRPQVLWQSLFNFLSQYLRFNLVLESVNTFVCHFKLILISEALIYWRASWWILACPTCTILMIFAAWLAELSLLMFWLGIQLAKGFPWLFKQSLRRNFC